MARTCSTDEKTQIPENSYYPTWNQDESDYVI